MSSKFAKYVRTRFGRRRKPREPQVRSQLNSYTLYLYPIIEWICIMIWPSENRAGFGLSRLKSNVVFYRGFE